MRIGLIAPPWIPVPPPAYGGTEEVIDNLARGLAALGHDVRLFTVGESTCPVPRQWLYWSPAEPMGDRFREAAHVLAAYQALAEAIDCPLHLGVTEAGALRSGTIKSSIGVGSLLWAGIGDTIRISLAADPVEEIKVGFDMLKSLGLRHRGVNIIACPSCARQGFNVIETVATLEARLAHISTPMSLSIIGCVVNGPGEALMTDLGFTGGGKGAGMVYVAGKPDHKMDNDQMVDHIVQLVEARARDIQADIDAAKQATLQAAE